MENFILCEVLIMKMYDIHMFNPNIILRAFISKINRIIEQTGSLVLATREL